MEEYYSTTYVVVTVALDLVASLSCLKDEMINSHRLIPEGPDPTYLPYPSNRQLGRQLGRIPADRLKPSKCNYDDSICIPILPTTSHPENYARGGAQEVCGVHSPCLPIAYSILVLTRSARY